MPPSHEGTGAHAANGRSRKKQTVVISVSGAALVAAVTAIFQLWPTHGTLSAEVNALRTADTTEARDRAKADARLSRSIDTLQTGMRYLVCRATFQDEGRDPRDCKALLRRFNIYPQAPGDFEP